MLYLIVAVIREHLDKYLHQHLSGTNWIAANTTSVANAINVGVNEVSDDAEKFVSFFSGNSGNLPNQVDAGIKYNPSTNY